MAKYVISDMHGQLGIFEKLLEKVAFSTSDYLYMIGDAIDRGPDGIKILQRVMAMENATFLPGNHEAMMLGSVDLDGEEDFPGDRTDLWLFYNGGEVTARDFAGLAKDDRKKIIDWLLGCPLSVETEAGGERFLLTHASFSAKYIGVPFKDVPSEDSWITVWGSPWRYDTYVSLDTFSEFEGKVVVGHVPVQRIRPEGGIKPHCEGNVINIDGGCAYGYGANHGGICLRLDDLESFAVQFEK